MNAPGAEKHRSAGVRLAGIGLLAAGVSVALYVSGRLHTSNFTFSLFGRVGLDAIALKAVLATIALGLAIVQVLLALWIYRKLPLAGGPPRPARLAHRVIGFGLFALTVPIAVHCLLAYGVQLTSFRVAVHSIAGCFFYGAFTAKVLLVTAGGCRAGRCRLPEARSPPSSACSGTPRRCGTTTASSYPACRRGLAVLSGLRVSRRPGRSASGAASASRLAGPGPGNAFPPAISRPLSRTCMCGTD
jgi:Family of unknown function (DUF6529)